MNVQAVLLDVTDSEQSAARRVTAYRRLCRDYLGPKDEGAGMMPAGEWNAKHGGKLTNPEGMWVVYRERRRAA